MKVVLQHPIEINSNFIQSVTLRRAKGKDMVHIAKHIPALMRLAEAAVPETATDEEKQAASLKIAQLFDGEVVEACIALAAHLGDLGMDAAMELDFDDLMTVANAAGDFLSLGGTSGAQSAPNAPQS